LVVYRTKVLQNNPS